ncbi:MAG: bifunctional histidinol-phosphatase/imidazoleglycerol-phosphate dehydratase HisB [Cytophagaceae bacterium]|nr:bifunctional histidinol-phosphatase/imidazoleglycerol-phosphate dehydratase HisB [Cytophagaceae bacterium]
MKKKVLFIDRDGTIILEPADEQIDSLEKLEFLPGVITALHKIARETDFEIVLVTNQDGLGTASFPEDTFWPAQNKMLKTLEGEGIVFKKIHIDRSFAKDNLPTRKPGIGMLTEYLTGNYDLANSFVIGDRVTDVQLAKNLGTKAIYITNEDKASNWGIGDLSYDLATHQWDKIYDHLVRSERVALVRRTTKETDITIQLKLDGEGKGVMQTGVGFFDHMLDQLCKHSGVNLDITVKGDLHIDEHHTIEDTALALGEAFLLALGSKKGIDRYGFLLPMDDSLAQVAIDFGGRSWLVWNAEFKREKIGDMPTEMFYHFFKSFTDTAKCNLNISVQGDNEHHKIEAIFKGFAKAIKGAIRKDPTNNVIPSTKGVL